MKRKNIWLIICCCLVLLGCNFWRIGDWDNHPPTPGSEASITVEVIKSQISPIDDMNQVFVPAGDFIMGSDDETERSSEFLDHPVYVDAFWIDKTEVTNLQYQQCVAAGVCTPPAEYSNKRGTDYEKEPYYDSDEYKDYPVNFVNWFQAGEYCAWAGRRLPTEAEWEKAARGTDGRLYPWGNEEPSFRLLNFKGKLGQASLIRGTTKVGSYKKGASPYGALDMAGNVSEWVADIYDKYPYDKLSEQSQGLQDDNIRIVRGGHWETYDYHIPSFDRSMEEPGFSSALIGFRCAQD